jgi:hypothetical protein
MVGQPHLIYYYFWHHFWRRVKLGAAAICVTAGHCRHIGQAAESAGAFCP